MYIGGTTQGEKKKEKKSLVYVILLLSKVSVVLNAKECCSSIHSNF